MAAHYIDVRRLVLTGKKSDSFASHFATFFNTESKPTPSLLREKITFSILWQGNPLSVQKSFGTKNCRLCLKESIHILKNLHTDPTKLINHNSEIYTSCRHQTRFHRFPQTNNGTDEPCTGRKSQGSTVTPRLVCRPVSNQQVLPDLNQNTPRSPIGPSPTIRNEHTLNNSNFICASPNYTISVSETPNSTASIDMMEL